MKWYLMVMDLWRIARSQEVKGVLSGVVAPVEEGCGRSCTHHFAFGAFGSCSTSLDRRLHIISSSLVDSEAAEADDGLTVVVDQENGGPHLF